jgi:lipoprotein NlpD
MQPNFLRLIQAVHPVGLRSGHGYQRLAQWNRLPPLYALAAVRKLKLFNSDQGYSAVAAMNPIKKNGRSSQIKLIFSDNKKIVLK